MSAFVYFGGQSGWSGSRDVIDAALRYVAASPHKTERISSALTFVELEDGRLTGHWYSLQHLSASDWRVVRQILEGLPAQLPPAVSLLGPENKSAFFGQLSELIDVITQRIEALERAA